MKQQCYMTHSISTNTKTNAKAFSYCSIQGHFHSEFGIAYHTDHKNIRWSMSVGCLIDPNSKAMEYMKQNIKNRPTIGCGAIIGSKIRALIISDTHSPYHHKDTIKFLLAAQEEHELDTILHIGDVCDHHTTSYHEDEWGTYGPMEEHERAIEFCQELESHFPKMRIAEGNHCLLNKRKARSAGIGEACLKSYNDNLELKGGWDWKMSHFFEIGDGQPLLLPMVLKPNGRWIGRIL